jgi:hypothetical protein
VCKSFSIQNHGLQGLEEVSDVWLAVPFAAKSPLHGSTEEQPKIIAPASTLRLVEKTSNVPPLPESDPSAVPKGKHWVDMVDEGTVVVIEQPPGQTCAALGGIMAARMKVRGVEGCVVGGRVRDLAELRKSALPVSSARATEHDASVELGSSFTYPPPTFLSTPCLARLSCSYAGDLLGLYLIS